MIVIKQEQVPKEVAMNIHDMLVEHGLGWASAKLSREIVAAALNAWPGNGICPIPHWPGPHKEVEQRPCLILPIQEPQK